MSATPIPRSDTERRARLHARIDAALAEGVTSMAELALKVQDLWPGATVAQVRGLIAGRNSYRYVTPGSRARA